MKYEEHRKNNWAEGEAARSVRLVRSGLEEVPVELRGSDKPLGSLGNKRSVEGAAWSRAGDPDEPLWSPHREADGCLGAAVEGTGKGLVAVMLDRVNGKEWDERKVWPVR